VVRWGHHHAILNVLHVGPPLNPPSLSRPERRSLQVELAIRALLQYDKKKTDNKDLLSGDGFIWVQCAFKKTPALHKSAKQL